MDIVVKALRPAEQGTYPIDSWTWRLEYYAGGDHGTMTVIEAMRSLAKIGGTRARAAIAARVGQG